MKTNLSKDVYLNTGI